MSEVVRPEPPHKRTSIMLSSSKNKKIILFAPRATLEVRHIGVPLSLLAVATPLSLEGFDITIIDGNLDDDYLDKISACLEGAFCVGITSMTGPQIKHGIKAANLVKERYPGLPVIWGGFHPTILPEQTLEHPAVDIVVRGQGEETFKELVVRISAGLAYDDVSGISFKKEGQVKNNPDRPAVRLDKLPPLNYELIDVERYIVKTDYATRALDYITSYGCPYKCSFCAEIFVNKRFWNALSAERVLSDIERLVERYKIDGLRLADSSFFIDVKRTENICRGLLSRNIKVTWGNVNGRTDNLLKYSDESWALMQKSGLRDILIGAESGSQEMLDFIDKEATIEDTIKLKRISSKYNVSLFVSTMIGVPYKGPKESRLNIKRDLYSVLDLIDKLQAVDNRHFIAIFIYTPFPGTPMYELSLKYGVKAPTSLEEWGDINLNTTNLPWVPKKYEKLVEYLTQFIFLYITVFYKKNASSRFTWVHRVFRQIAIFRMKYRFFHLRFDYFLLQAYRRRIHV